MKLPFIEECLIVSIYDYTGNWAKPFIEAGYPTMLWDKKIEGDILSGFDRLVREIEETGLQPYGYLFAPPCTHMAVSGARWWAEKDKQLPDPGDIWNEVDYHIAYASICLHLVDILPPTAFWCLENPVGRLEKFLPELKPFRKMMFDPCDYGDPYTKKTVLWGEFNRNMIKKRVEPVMVEMNGKRGSIFWAMGPSENRAAMRSITPMGFANAFYHANKLAA